MASKEIFVKVGILTFHNAYNYGAVLQTYATQELLKSMGYSVEVIDYHNPKIDAYYGAFDFSFKKICSFNPYKILKGIIVPFLYNKRKTRFGEFSCHLNLSKKTGIGDPVTGYHAILIGSDQVWSIRHTGGFDTMYWGNFPVPSETKKIAWSVCMGDTSMDNYKDIISNNLRNFSAISVRELSLKNFLKAISDREVTATLDPTLVTDKNVWNSLCHPVKEHDYIVVYAVKHLPETLAIAKKVRKILNKEIIVIAAYPGRPIGMNVKQSCGPQDFLSYIKNASLVVTSSFHGTVFSILFEKDFISIIPDGKVNLRVKELLTSLDLSERIIGNPKGIKEMPKIDYNNVNALLEKAKEETIHFLQESLN